MSQNNFPVTIKIDEPLQSILMIFLDGVGIGKEDYQHNPFFKYKFKLFTKIFNEIPSTKKEFISGDGAYVFPTDARLGVAGFPQSGTGQASILCGINAPQFVGKHFGPFPYSTLIPIIETKNIFRYFLSNNKKVYFANGYPKAFFNYLKSEKPRLSVTPLGCRLSGVKINRTTEVRRGKAITAEIINSRWNQKLNYNLPEIKPGTAARRLLNISGQNHFTMYEYYLTDYIGHGRYDGDIEKTVSIIDEFLYTIITEMDKAKLTLLVCSDHGNFEDLSVKTHTLNNCFTLSAGKNAKILAQRIKNISEIKQELIGTFL